MLKCDGASVYSLAVTSKHIICGTYENMIHVSLCLVYNDVHLCVYVYNRHYVMFMSMHVYTYVSVNTYTIHLQLLYITIKEL